MSEVPSAAVPIRGTNGRARAARKTIRRWLKILAFVFVFYYLVLPQIAGIRKAAHELIKVRPVFLVAGLALEGLCLLAYAQLTRAALPRRSSPALFTIFRIQLATKAVTNVVPGGTAAGSALGYRLLTASGVAPPDAGFALATSGMVSAVVLNVLLWLALVVSIPTRGFNPLYGTAAVIGALLLGGFAVVVVALIKGRERAERVVRTVARKVRLDEEKAAAFVKRLAARLRDLGSDRRLLVRLVVWASLNWLLDAAALWVFLRAYGATAPIDGLLVAFCLANVMAALPITPGGLGIVEGILIPTLVGFGAPAASVALAVPTYRLAQFWLPIPLGAVAYGSLRVGPWAVDKELPRLRQEAEQMVETVPGRLEWNERFGERPPDGGAYRVGGGEGHPQ